MRTIEVFREWNPELEIVLVLNAHYLDYWAELCEHCNFASNLQVVSGGETRFHSVKKGIEAIEKGPGIIGVHDAVRPLVSIPTIESAYRAARSYGSAVPVIEIVDSLRVVLGDGRSHIVDRSRYRSVQTPQCFESDLLRRAYEQDYRPSFTDSASVVEALGETVHLIDGNRDNIKLTTPTDMSIAGALWRDRKDLKEG
jgi:2-C-methyl-D-erythritol 4-phosphate cytidylyltransferase